MVRIFSIIILSLSILLFPPATLAVISNNSVPGDATYPLKRGLEDMIFAVASINPTTKAWFAAARSDRRFKELGVLITRGKKVGETLNELVEQTQIAADQISQVDDQSQKEKLVQQLSQSIQKYDQALQRFSPTTSSQPPASQPTITVTPLPQSQNPPKLTKPSSTAAPIPRPSLRPISTPTPAPPELVTQPPQPTVTPAPSQTVIPSIRPNTIPVPHRDEEDYRKKEKEIEEARKRLEEIKNRLEEKQRKQEEDHRDKQENQPKFQEYKKQPKPEKREDSEEVEVKKGNRRSKD
ncbi:hypothetical protein HY384_03005 [Candidatus Daviesbacteria bacterium]|nr:hypothetical protein [Candidatus Daviesbacteria bacterium]